MFRFKLYKNKLIDIIEVLAYILCLWLVFFPKPYFPIMILAICLPVIGIIVNGITRKSIRALVTIDSNSFNNSEKFILTNFISFISLAIFLRGLIDIKIINYSQTVLPSLFVLTIAILLVIFTHKIKFSYTKHNLRIIASLMLSLTLYSFSSAIAINYLFDYSKPISQSFTITNKGFSNQRKARFYYIDTEVINRIIVTKNRYDNIKIGNNIDLILKQGLLNINWYYQK